MSVVAAYSEQDVLRIANTFPSSQQIFAQLAVLLKDPDTGLNQISVLIKRDVSLAARLIRIANSAAFAQDNTVASVEDAVTLIGFKEVYRLVGCAVLEDVSNLGLGSYGITGERFRANSLFSGLLMEELAVGAQEDPRFCYTIGLLRSIGKAALDRLSRGTSASPIRPMGEDENILDWERSAFGITNTEAAVIILKKWRFPHEIFSAIEGHYSPEGRLMPLTHLLNLSSGVAEVLGHGLPGETKYWIDSDVSYVKAGLRREDASGIIDHTLATFNRLIKARF